MMQKILQVSIMASAVVLLVACQSSGPKSGQDTYATTTDPSQLLGPASRPQLQGTEVTARSQAEAHTALALGYYERGQFEVALEELDLAKGLDSSYAMTYNGYGLVYAHMREDVKARSNFEQAVRLDPGNPEIRHNWGWFLCTSGSPRESLTEFDRVLADPLYKSAEVASTNAGRCALVAGDIERGRNYLLNALKVKPNYAPAAYTLADIAYRQGDYTNARNYIKMSMQTPTPTPAALYLGACIERRLGDKQAEDSYVLQLRNRYPKAPQAERILSPGACS
jgi:type IV pilus biogenesis/stability protein PilW